MCPSHTPNATPVEGAQHQALEGSQHQAIQGRKFHELDASTAAMLEAQEVPAIQGSGDEWWCPNPTCEVIDK